MSADATTSHLPPRLKGTVLAGAVKWVRTRYGEPFFLRVLGRLPEEMRAVLTAGISPAGWYPIEVSEGFQDACYEEIAARTGESRESFEKRSTREAGNDLLKATHRFFLAFLKPQNLLKRFPLMYQYIFNQGQVEVVESRSGRCVLRCRGPEELYAPVRRLLQYAVPYILEVSGAKGMKLTFVREEKGAGGYLLEVLLTYR